MEQFWNHLRAKLINYETISYLVFGVLTTLTDWISYGIMTRYGRMDYRIATAGAWAAAVLFAFVTNKLFVFQSRSLSPRKIWEELIPFVTCRVATGLFTLAAMVAMVDGIGIRRDLLCKVVVSGISLVLNYVLSKWFVFKKTS
ncbi:MAG: GtrA family protein [Lachnospiraceae bacterium]|nr:GtrA family protein [Lachnospiraceae bacterium]